MANGLNLNDFDDQLKYLEGLVDDFIRFWKIEDAAPDYDGYGGQLRIFFCNRLAAMLSKSVSVKIDDETIEKNKDIIDYAAADIEKSLREVAEVIGIMFKEPADSMGNPYFPFKTQAGVEADKLDKRVSDFLIRINTSPIDDTEQMKLIGAIISLLKKIEKTWPEAAMKCKDRPELERWLIPRFFYSSLKSGLDFRRRYNPFVWFCKAMAFRLKWKIKRFIDNFLKKKAKTGKGI